MTHGVTTEPVTHSLRAPLASKGRLTVVGEAPDRENRGRPTSIRRSVSPRHTHVQRDTCACVNRPLPYVRTRYSHARCCAEAASRLRGSRDRGNEGDRVESRVKHSEVLSRQTDVLYVFFLLSFRSKRRTFRTEFPDAQISSIPSSRVGDSKPVRREQSRTGL